MGERAVIQMIQNMQGEGRPGFVGIGDDAAQVPGGPQGWLISQDMLMEGVHFRWDWSTPEQVGEKAAHVNLSDMAAMGASPEVALTALAIPGSMSFEVVESLYRGLTRVFDAHGVAIVGGDTIGSPDRLVLDVTILGRPGPQGAVLRRGAVVGDRLVVSGWLGASFAGYMLLSHGVSWPGENITEKSLLTAHLYTHSRVALGQAVAPLVHAMTDVSDGLIQEVPEMVNGSLGVDVWVDRLPISRATRLVADRYQTDPLMWALYGAEDYELLMAVPPEQWDTVKQVARGVQVTLHEIGIVTNEPGIRWLEHGQPRQWKGQGVQFDHFSI